MLQCQNNFILDKESELKRLRKHNKCLKIEREILKKTHPSLKRNELKYKFIKTEKKACPTALLCKMMKVFRSGYYSWESRDKSKSQKEREALLPIVINASEKSKRTFGICRIAGLTRAYDIFLPKSTFNLVKEKH